MKNPLSNLDNIYWDLAKKYNLRKEVIENIIECQFRFVHELIKNSDINDINTFKSVNLTHLGKYLPRKWRIHKHMKDYYPEAYEKIKKNGTKDNI